MIYVVGYHYLKRYPDGRRYFQDAPEATMISIQRPFSTLGLGPLITDFSREETVSSLKEYKKWLFKVLLQNKQAIDEFTRLLDIVIEEGDLVLQCSCSNNQYCHGSLIKDALEWAIPFGIEGWHDQLKRVNVSK